MEEFILEYLFQSASNDLIKGNDYKVLIYLFKLSYHEGFAEEITVTSSDAVEALGLSAPTYNKAIENLEFAGLIEKKTFRGSNGGTKVTILFLQEIYKARNFSEEGTRELESIINKEIPITRAYTQIKMLEAKKTSDSEDFKYKDSLQFVPVKYKDSLQFRLSNIKKFYNSFLLNIKEFYNSDAKYKDSLQFSPLKYKVSLHFFIDAKSIELNKLVKIEDQRYKNIRAFFAKLGTIYNRKYITIICVIDTLFFDGKLFDRIEDAVIEEKSQKKTSNYHRKNFILNDDTKKHIPVHLLNHSEIVFGESVTFIESLQNWLAYKERQGDNVSYDSMLKNLKWLGTLKNPVESIEASIKADAKNIFQATSSKYQSAQGDDSETKVVGKIRTFE